MNAVRAITRANLRRLLAERSNLFFLVILPLMIVFALGLAIGGAAGDYRVGVVDAEPSAISTSVSQRMDDTANITVVRYSDAGDLRDDVARRTLDVGWITEPAGDGVTFQWLAPASGDAIQLRNVFAAAVEEAGVQARVVAVVAERTGATTATAAEAVDAASQAAPMTEVIVEDVGDPAQDAASLRAGLAAGQLSLFIFLSSLMGATYLLTTRQLGVTRRMRAAPVTVTAIVAGEALARFLVALLQAGIVFFGSMLLFGVDWRAPVAVGLLCVGMSLVGTGAAMLLGILARTEQQVSAIGLLLALSLGALGGSMQPLEFFPDTLRTLAFATPHAGMNDALWRILVEGAELSQVWPAIGVLSAAGVALLAVSSAAMARTLR